MTPAANQNGTATITVTVNDGALTATDTFVLTVTAVNDAPSFTKGADQTAVASSGAKTVAGWATAISDGPADESAQTETFTVTNSNNALFSVQPAVSPTGTLTYTPSATTGAATVSVRVQDNGGTANGGVNQSAIQTFTITITSANTPPTISNITNRTILEDANTGAVTFTIGDAQTAGEQPGGDGDVVEHGAGAQRQHHVPRHHGHGPLAAGDPGGEPERHVHHHGHGDRRWRDDGDRHVRAHGHRGERRSELHQGRRPDRGGQLGCEDGDGLGNGDQRRAGERDGPDA